jgi:hypothetical protein
MKCSITTNELRTLPEIHGEMHSTIDTTRFHIPDKISVIADHEIPLIKEITPGEVARLDHIKSKVMVPSQTFDVNSLNHINQATLRQGRQTFWHLIVTTSICAVAVMIILYLSLRSTLRKKLANCFAKRSNPGSSTTEQSPYQPPQPKPRACISDSENIQKEVAFTSYALRPAS